MRPITRVMSFCVVIGLLAGCAGEDAAIEAGGSDLERAEVWFAEAALTVEEMQAGNPEVICNMVSSGATVITAGADGDFLTIAEALDQAAATEGNVTIIVSSGTYTDPVVVDERFADPASSLVITAECDPDALVRLGGGVIIRDAANVQVASVLVSGSPADGVRVTGSSNIMLRHMITMYSWRDGVHVEDSENVLALGVDSSNNGGSGMYATRSSAAFAGGWAEGNADHGIYSYHSNSMYVREAELIENGRYGVFSYYGGIIQVDGTRAEGNRHSGVRAYGAGFLIVRDSALLANRYYGVYSTRVGTAVLNSVAVSNKYGMRFSSCSATAMHNEIRNHRYGIYLTYAPAYGSATITNNLLVNNAYGVLNYRTNRSTIRNNTIDGGSYGIYHSGANGARYTDNIVANSNYSVRNNGGVDVVMDNNNFTGYRYSTAVYPNGNDVSTNSYDIDPEFGPGHYYSAEGLKGIGLLPRWQAGYFREEVTGYGDTAPGRNEMTDLGFHHQTAHCVDLYSPSAYGPFGDPDTDGDGVCDDLDASPF